MTIDDLARVFETTGGKIAALALLLIWLTLIAFVMHMTQHDPSERTIVLLSNAFTSLMTVLLSHLSGKPPNKV